MGSEEKTELDIAAALKVSDELTHPVKETLPQEQWVYQVKVMTAFLRAAIPLNKVKNLRDLLENGFCLNDQRHNIQTLSL